jgi:hypothetical protein
MASLEERLEQLENAVLVIAGGSAGYQIGKGSLRQAVTRGVSANPVGAGTLALIALQRAGMLDPVVEELVDRGLRNPTIGVSEGLGGVSTAVRKEAKKQTRKVTTKFNKAIRSGMSIVKASTSFGKKGTINNARKAFSKVTKTVSRVNKGLKLPKTGITRKIALAAKRIL